MKYEKAKDILPEELLKEVQKYAAGKLLYIPSGDDKKTWGEASGYRTKLKKRNQMICNKYSNGMTISELADEYFLSIDAIKKIVYSKKVENVLEYEPTLTCAKAYSAAGMMEEWIQSYLIFTCNNDDLSDRLLLTNHYYFGPAKLPLRLVNDVIDENAIIQPNEIMLSNQTNEGCFHQNTFSLQNSFDLPPLIIQYDNKKFYISENRVLYKELKSQKVNAYPVIIWIKDYSDYVTFMEYFGSCLRTIN